MKTTEIREMTINEIIERLDAEKQELSRMKLNHHVSPLENPMKIRHARRNISRLLTILTQKQLMTNK